MPGGRPSVFWITSGLFVASGATGLAYEVIWFKRFSQLWGNSTLAMACVVSAFLFGLGLGAHLLGRIADRARSPLSWYGACEIAIGALGLLIPLEIAWLFRLGGALYPALHELPVLYSLARIALTFVILGPPCFLMGGTLPLLIRQFTPAGATLRHSTAWLYAVNTAGAAAGCALAGFLLLPALGLLATNALTAAVNVAVGLAALAAARAAFGAVQLGLDPVAEHAPAPDPAARGGGPDAMFYASVALAGAASLGLQMVWARQLAVMLGGSTYAFSAMLFVFLVGIGLGSLIFHAWLRERPRPAIPAVVIAILVVSAFAGKWAIPQLTMVVGLLGPLRESQLFNAVACVGASAVLELLPTIAMGILFPVFVDLTRRAARDAGKAVGTVYGLNTAGCIAGSLVAPLILVPALGTDQTFAWVLGAYLVVMAVLHRAAGPAPAALLVACAVPSLAATILSVRAADPRLTNYGMYLYGYVDPRKIDSEVQTLLFREGPACNVLVTHQTGFDEPTNLLRLNGKIDASDVTDMPFQAGAALFARMLHPGASDVLVIGYGSGVSAGCSLLYPGTSVVCCEIEPAVIEASQFFSHVNHRPETSERFTLVLDDGRNFLQGTDARFDIIITETSNPWLAGTSNLFTREFYGVTRDHLREGGLVVQWIQLYSLSTTDYAMIAETVATVFPHCVLLHITTADTMVVASMSPIDLTAAGARAAQTLVDSTPAVQEDLRKYFDTTDVASLLAAHVILDEEDLKRFIERHGTGRINTDVNMRLEFTAPRRLFATRIDKRDLPAWSISSAATSRWLPGLLAGEDGTVAGLNGLRERADLLLGYGHVSGARRVAEIALELDPDMPEFLTERLVIADDMDRAAVEDAAAALAAVSAEKAILAGQALGRAGRGERAAVFFELLTGEWPDSSTVWANLALSYARLGDHDRAEAAFRRALALDPADPFAVEQYERFQSASNATTR